MSGGAGGSGGENGGLKLNVNPTEREEGSVERPEGEQSPGTKSKADKDLAIAIPEEEKKDEKAADGDDDD